MPRQLEVFWMLLTGNRQFKTQYLLATAQNKGTIQILHLNCNLFVILEKRESFKGKG